MDPILPQTPTPFPELNQTPVPPIQGVAHPHFINKKFATFFVLAVLVAGASYAALQYYQTNRAIDSDYVPAFTPRMSENSEWKTYTNTQYGFEFKYPRDWHVLNNSIWPPDSSLAVSFDVNPIGTFKKDPIAKNLKQITLGERIADVLDVSPIRYVVVPISSSQELKITLPLPTTTESIYNQILSTFKFTK